MSSGPSWRKLATTETAVQLRLLRRNPLSVLFTVALPLLLLPLLDALNGGTRVRLPAAPSGVPGPGVDEFGTADWMQYATPAIAAFAVVAACFANLAIRTAVAREHGVLKRVRGTPLPPSAHLTGRILSNAAVAVFVALTTMAAGWAAYGVEMAVADLPVLIGLVVLGAAAFSALGLAATGIVPNSDAAPAIVYALLFPLAFLSNVFYPPELAPDWMQRTSEALPLGPFVSGAVGAVTPTATGSGVLLDEVAALLGWGAFGAIVAVATFRWVPNRERTVAPRSAAAAPVLRRLALPIALLVLTVGVVLPDDDRPPAEIVVGSLEELRDAGVLTTEIVVETDDIELRSGSDVGVVLGDQTTAFSGGFVGVDTASSTAGAALRVSVFEGLDGPAALGFPDCGVRPVSAVDAEWVGAVAADRTGGALVQPCSGAVYELDGSCAAGPCVAPLVMPVDVTDGRIVVEAGGAIDPSLAAAGGGDPAPTAPDGTYRGRAIVGGGADAEIVEGTFTLRGTDEGGVRIASDDVDFEVQFVGSALLGTLSGVDVVRGAGLTEFVTSIVTATPLPWLSVETGDEVDITDPTGDYRVSRPEDDLRMLELTLPGTTEAEPVASLRLRTDGPLLEWASIDLDLRVEGSPQVRLELTRS